MPGRFIACLAFAALAFSALPILAQDSAWVYVGTYTGRTGSKGIYKLELDLKSGALTNQGLAVETENPTFLAFHPTKKYLYAVNEISKFKDEKAGAISAFALDAKTGDLKFLNQESAVGTGPCHLTVDKTGQCVLAANYGGGSTVVLPIKDDGRLGSKTAFIQHEGMDAAGRKIVPHGHSVNLDASNRLAFVADLGLDKILIYKLDPAKGTLAPHTPPHASLAQGAGPRHFAFDPAGKHAYAINERSLTITAFDYNSDKGTLTETQTISTIPKVESTKGFSTAEVVVHPSGKFLYGSNRGHNSIAIFSIDPMSGKLTVQGHQSHLIKTPRNFVIDPTGQFLLAAGQDNGKVVVFRIDPSTGHLTPTGSVAEVAAPVCLRVLPK